MLKTVVLAKNPFEPESWVKCEVSDLREFLMQEFDKWPDTGRIYHGNVSEANDVTPHDDAEIDRLASMPGPFYVVVYPGVVNLLYAAIVAIVAIVAVAVIMKPSVPNALRNTQQQSPNNELSSRENKSRPLSRIPDIYGTVRSTPDLIATPYTLFVDHQEVEYAYMCIGRGQYDVSDVRDDKTRVEDIPGCSVEVYGPYSSPNSGFPQLRIGTEISTPVLNVTRSNSVNGQVLRPPNDQRLTGNGNIRFSPPNQIQLVPGSELDFTDKFAPNDELVVSNGSDFQNSINETRAIIAANDGSFVFQAAAIPAQYTVGRSLKIVGALFSILDNDSFWASGYDVSGEYVIAAVSIVNRNVSGVSTPFVKVSLQNASSVNPKWLLADNVTSTNVALSVADGTELFNLSGVYTVLSVAQDTITLSNPGAVNAAWNTLTTTEYLSPTLYTTGSKWIGPFVLDKTDTTDVFGNFVALNGLYKDDGDNQQRFDVTVEIELTPIAADGTPTGPAETFQTTIEGSATYRSTRAATLKAKPTFTGRCEVRARRVTPADLEFKGSIVDEIKWRDVFAASPAQLSNFGDVTTVQSVTYATSGALALKERKLNMEVTRVLEARQPDGSFIIGPTNNAGDILRAVCFDPRIGDRSSSEVDQVSIYGAIDEIVSYFGTDIAAEFNYTFDADNLSFEEMVSTIADAVFCKAYRRGNVIKLSFEKQTADSVLLFNHRNKLPGTELRTVSFGNDNDNDGVEYQYIDPDDDASITYYIPQDRSAVNPKKVESVGIRNHLQAYLQAYRVWNKIQYANQTIEFEATQEADLIIPQDRILVADNTRPDTQDGEIEEQNGLELTLSQEVQLDSSIGNTIFIQHIDGSVEAIPVARIGTEANKIILANAPKAQLATDDDLYARATYVIVGNNSKRQSAFLVAEKTPNGNFTSVVKGVNYDDRYYSNDFDYKNGVVNINANIA